VLKKKLDYMDILIHRRNISAFKVEDVGMLLKEIGLGNFHVAFEQHHIEGSALNKMKETLALEWRRLGIHNIHDRKKIIHAIDLIQNHGILHPLQSINTVSNWNSERVCQWLKEIGFGGIVEQFKKMNINGVVLLYLYEEDLEDILLIHKKYQRIRLLHEIAKLRFKFLDQMATASQLQKESKLKSRIPDSFYCPITMELMKDPVMAKDGFVYERNAIEMWLQQHKTSPLTNLQLEDISLIPCHRIKNAIDDLLKGTSVWPC
jgi:hypothetical protein